MEKNFNFSLSWRDWWAQVVCFYNRQIWKDSASQPARIGQSSERHYSFGDKNFLEKVKELAKIFLQNGGWELRNAAWNEMTNRHLAELSRVEARHSMWSHSSFVVKSKSSLPRRPPKLPNSGSLTHSPSPNSSAPAQLQQWLIDFSVLFLYFKRWRLIKF